MRVADIPATYIALASHHSGTRPERRNHDARVMASQRASSPANPRIAKLRHTYGSRSFGSISLGTSEAPLHCGAQNPRRWDEPNPVLV